VDRVDFLQGEVSYRAILPSESAPGKGGGTSPLLQYGIAARCGRLSEEFGVGVQRRDASEPEVTAYSQEELEAALARFGVWPRGYRSAGDKGCGQGTEGGDRREGGHAFHQERVPSLSPRMVGKGQSR
jgi:hypothetical protein